MRLSFSVLLLGVLALTACSSVEERQQKALDTFEFIKFTASGAAADVTDDLNHLKEATNEATKQIDGLVKGIEERAIEVQSGAKMIQKGAKAVNDAFTQ